MVNSFDLYSFESLQNSFTSACVYNARKHLLYIKFSLGGFKPQIEVIKCKLKQKYITEDGRTVRYAYFSVSDVTNDILLTALAYYGAISGQYIYVHRCVYALSTREYIRGYDVHHVDGNATNNDISNLVKLTPKEHKELHRANPFIKSSRPKRLTKRKINHITKLLKEGKPYRLIASKLKVSTKTISDVKKSIACNTVIDGYTGMLRKTCKKALNNSIEAISKLVHITAKTVKSINPLKYAKVLYDVVLPKHTKHKPIKHISKPQYIDSG